VAVELHITKKGETTCVALLGEFEPAGVDELRARLGSFRDDHAQPVLDLGHVVVVDAATSDHGTATKDPASGRLDPSA
jgi:mRNA-degrading endonuclease toxin of MazEF toxin-antitoxin module